VVFRPSLAAHGDGLEVFAAQHCAHARAAGRARVRYAALHHAGIAHQPLARQADARHLRLGIGLGAHLVEDVVVVVAP
jgi:hypothetical protein